MKPLHIADGTLEGLKWLALILMTGDHINKYLFNGTVPFLFEAGRLALPLFVFVLSYNLARPGFIEQGGYPRIIKRLTFFGAVSSIPFIALGSLYAGWFPLNVIYLLLIITLCTYLLEKNGTAYFVTAISIFLIGGSLVEYWWPGVALGLAIWSYYKQPTWLAALFTVLVCVSLWFINRNLWALVAVPLILAATHIHLPILRLRWAFYIYYPLHLAVLWLIRIPMRKAGYLFFNMNFLN